MNNRHQLLKWGAVWFLGLALLSPFNHAATFTWNGGDEGLWEDPSRWSPQQVPGENDTAVIDGTEEAVIRVDGVRSVQTLVLGNPNATLLLEGSGSQGQAILTVARGFVNEGTIDLSSEVGSFEARLTVGEGALTNAPGGVIRISEGTGGPRILNASLDNRGLLEVSRDLTFNGAVANNGTVHLAEGRTLRVSSATIWTHRSGAITGSGTLALAQNSTFVLEGDFIPGGFILDASNLTINGPARLLGPVTGEFLIRNWTINAEVVVTGDLRIDGVVNFNGPLAISAGKTLRLRGSVNQGQAILTVARGFVNEGTIDLSSEVGSFEARLTVGEGSLTNAPGGVIRISEGTGGPRILNASLDNRGLLEVSRDLTFNGAVANNGTVHLAEGRTLRVSSATIWTHRSGAITGSGTLALAQNSTFVLEGDFIPGGFILDASNLTINGPARLLGPVTGEFLIRNWTINAEVVVTGDLRIDGVVNFNGPLAISAGKTLRLRGSVNQGQAILTVARGFVNEGTIDLSSEVGSFEARLTVGEGSLTNAPGGVIQISEGTGGPRILNASLDNRGTLEVSRDLTFNGAVANNGTVHLAEGRTLRVSSATIWTHRSGAITGSGTLALAQNSTFVLEGDFIPGGFILDASNLTINGPARLLGPVTGEFLIRNWTINAEVVVTGDLRIDGVVNFNGPLAISAGKTLRLRGSVNQGQAILTVARGFVNEGTIDLSSEVGSFEARLTVGEGSLTNAPGGVIRISEGTGGPRILNASLDNRGTLLVMRNAILNMTGTLLNTSAGILAGNGDFNLAGATVAHEGIVAPGASPGILTVSGNLPHGAGSRFVAEIGGFTAGTEHDQLVLANPVMLDGTIRAALINGFFPKKDDAFPVLNYPSHTGAFATLDNPLPERIAWEIRYGPTSAQLVVLNTAPTLAAIPDPTVNELVQLSVTASATDQDLPAQALTFSLVEAPGGMTIHPTTGVITWTPTEAQGPGRFDVTVRVSDNGTPSLGDSTRFSVTVQEVNVAPQLALPGSRESDEETGLVFTLGATDTDLPANPLTYALILGPPGATFDPDTREFRWTPTEAQGPGDFTASFRVTDSNPEAVNERQLDSEGLVRITVREVNRPPVLAAMGAQSMEEESLLKVSAAAMDPDLPANGLTYSLDAAPAGMTIDPATGAISWTPAEAQGPGGHEVTVRVTDNGSPARFHTTGFRVEVREVNRSPVLDAVTDVTIHAGTRFATQLGAADFDLPANTFTFSLVEGPQGATVSANGELSWTSSREDSGSTTRFVVRVTDDGVPPRSGEDTFQVAVAEPVEILSLDRNGGDLTIRWRAVAGSTYRLIGAATLQATAWEPASGEVTATGVTASLTFAMDPQVSASFLRVELVR